MPSADELVARLERTWHGHPWYGDSSDAILAGITPASAAHRLAGVTHSICEIVLHMTAWTEELAARVRGGPKAEPARGDWPPPLHDAEAAWPAALTALAAARADLVAAIREQTEQALGLLVPASEFSRFDSAYGLADHDAYHLGQVAMIKKAVRAAL